MKGDRCLFLNARLFFWVQKTAVSVGSLRGLSAPDYFVMAMRKTICADFVLRRSCSIFVAEF